MEILTTVHRKNIVGELSCFDRVIITGTLPQICYSSGMTSYLYSKDIRIFDYPKFAEPFKEEIRANTEKIAKQNNIEIEFVSKPHIRKEDLVKKVLEKRGGSVKGVFHILSAMEACGSYKPWHDKQTGKTYLKGAQSKCLHYYFYFIDEYLGYGYIRVPTWCPFKLQIYINGHNILANELDKHGLKYSMIDNAFDYIEDFSKAQEICNDIDIKKIHKRLDELAKTYCPVYESFNQVYHWSTMQAEYATDIVFKDQQYLQSIYSELIATAIHTVKPDNIASFLGHKVDPRYQGEMGNNYNIRIEGSRIKHTMGKSSIKMYDKFSKILRIETTTNDISFFKHYREVEHRDGTKSMQFAPLKKNIYSLTLLALLFAASNKRYLEFISAFDNKEAGRKRLDNVTKPKQENNRNYKGFNLFCDNDLALLLTVMRGEYNIAGFRNKDIRRRLPNFNTGKISRLIKRLKVFGLIKRAGKTYKYYLTRLGKELVITAQKLKETVLIPALNY
ncbi:MAG: MarR family transcriptional regulator [Bacteroidales bacterium]|nr:MarR family transcriptional regulator [Bacteroidales bacterium]